MPKHQKVDDMADGCNASTTAYTTRSTGHTRASPRATWFLLKDQSFLLRTHKHQWRDKAKHQMQISTQKKELLSFLFMFWGPKSTQLPTFWTSESTQHLSNHPFLSTPWHLQDVESSTRWPNPRKCRNLSCFQHVQSTHLCFKRSIFCRLITVNSLVRNVTSTATSIGYEDLFLKQRRAFVGFFIFWGQKLNLDNRPFSMTPTNMVSWSQTHGLHITYLYLKIDGSSCLRPILINSYWFGTFHSKHLSHSFMYIWNKREKCIEWNISLGKKKEAHNVQWTFIHKKAVALFYSAHLTTGKRVGSLQLSHPPERPRWMQAASHPGWKVARTYL